MGRFGLFADDPREPFEQKYGYGSSPDTFIQTDLDAAMFERLFGKPGFATLTFNFKHPEWTFRRTDTHETIKAVNMDGLIVFAFKSEETLAKFLAFVESRNRKPAAGG